MVMAICRLPITRKGILNPPTSYSAPPTTGPNIWAKFMVVLVRALEKFANH